MLIDTHNLHRISDHLIVGEAKRSNGILQEGELVVVADGLQTFLDHVEEAYPHPKHDESSSGYSYGFHTFTTYDEAMNTFRDKPGSLVKYDPAEIRPVDFAESGNDVEFNVTGDFIDIGRVLEGVPETFGSMHNGNTRNRRVRIVVDNGHWSGTPEHYIIHRSERIIRLVDALENARVRTELTVVDSGGSSHTEVTIKRFDESLVLEDVAVATHTDFLRRVCFRVCEYSRIWRPGYGDPKWLLRKKDAIRSTLNDELTIYVQNSMAEGIDQQFDKLEHMIEDELSEPVPTSNLIMISDTSVASLGL